MKALLSQFRISLIRLITRRNIIRPEPETRINETKRQRERERVQWSGWSSSAGYFDANSRGALNAGQ
jgi:hypothetical protein